MTHSRLFTLPLVTLAMLASGCGNNRPGPDVAATVNGREITFGEVSAEVVGQGIANPSERDRQAALQMLVDRKLLVGLAEKQRLDRTAAFVRDEQRAKDVLLAQAAAGWLSRPPVEANRERAALSDSQASQIGAQRILYQVERVAFDRPSPEIVKSLQGAESLDEIEGRLKQAGVPSQRIYTNWDSALMPPGAVAQLAEAHGSKPVLIAIENKVTAAVILNKRAAPLSESEAFSLTDSARQQQEAQERLDDWLKKARATARITYSPAFSAKTAGNK
jgi:EpsD family peptidyl-prolyl cis-trans isomerase